MVVLNPTARIAFFPYMVFFKIACLLFLRSLPAVLILYQVGYRVDYYWFYAAAYWKDKCSACGTSRYHGVSSHVALLVDLIGVCN